MRTLHPQWGGYTYTWWRDRDLLEPVRRERGEEYDQDLRDSPFLILLNAAGTRDLPLRLRRRLAGCGAQRDFPILEELAIAGATDYFAELIPVGMVTEAFPDSGIGFSFATVHPAGFGSDDLRLIEAVHRWRLRSCPMPSTRLALVCLPHISVATPAVVFTPVWSSAVLSRVSRRSMVRGYPRLHPNGRRDAWAGSR